MSTYRRPALADQPVSEYPWLFDPDWYVSQEGVRLAPGQSALEHFLSVGRQANLAPGPWFDPEWYWERNPDVASAGVPAFDHYVWHGILEGRRPHPDFDAVSYASRNDLEGVDPFEVLADWVTCGGPTSMGWRLENLGLLDVEWLRDANGWGGLSDEECVERLLSGSAPRPGPLFDPDWYVSQEGVRLAPGQSALEHFLSVGRQANLAPGPWFDPEWYWERNPDVASAGVPAFDHYVWRGILEGRRPHPDFDAVSYASRNDLEGVDPFEVLADWVTCGGPTSMGWRLENLGLLDVEWLRDANGWGGLSDEECVERLLSGSAPRPGPLFDPDWYVSQEGVRLAPGQSALEHFLSVGRQANLAPGPWFDPEWYWERNPDVASAGVPAFDHYVWRGILEGRRPHPDFDAVSYASRNDLEGVDPFEVLADWVTCGGPTSMGWRLENLGLLDVEWLRDANGWGGLSDEECVERLLSGSAPRPGPLFDPDWYVSQEGVRLAPGQSALEHFLSVGRQANLAPGPWFDPEWYWERNPDVASAGVPAFDHYVWRGILEGRRPHPDFDAVSYASRNDLEGVDPFEVLADWVTCGGPTSMGWRLENLGLLDVEWLRDANGWGGLSDEECVERLLSGSAPRPGPLFDPDWYVSQEGVRLAPGQSALEHFLSVGRQANLAPGPWFDPEWYWERNPDVASAGVPAFDHYLFVGENEGRAPSEGFVPRLSGTILQRSHRALERTSSAWKARLEGRRDLTDPDWFRAELVEATAIDPRLGTVTLATAMRNLTEPFMGRGLHRDCSMRWM